MNRRLPIALIASLVLAACGQDDSTPDEGTDAGADTTGAADTGAATDTGGDDAGGEDAAPEGCVYPENDGTIAYGQVIPNMSWDGAYLGDGSQLDFSFESFHCDPEWSNYGTLMVVMHAGWCPACPSTIQYIDSLTADLEAAGMKVVFLEVQTADVVAATNEDCHHSVNNVVGEGGPQLRIGEAENQPEPSALYFSGINRGVMPFIFIVRRADMKVIVAGTDDGVYPDYVGIASDPANVAVPEPPPPVCGEGAEEPFEPNDVPDQAGMLTPGETVDGGICGDDVDFYLVDVPGAWQLDLEFSDEVGDLDIAVYDREAGDVLLDDQGFLVGGETSTDNESFQYRGPSEIIVYGHRGATATYRLTLTAL